MFKKIKYEDLQSKQRESFNYQKIAAKLADYGYQCVWLPVDVQGADFIAVHHNVKDILRVQLKGKGLCFSKKYMDKDIHIAVRSGDDWYIYPHDELLERIGQRIVLTPTWEAKGHYDITRAIPKKYLELMDQYRL